MSERYSVNASIIKQSRERPKTVRDHLQAIGNIYHQMIPALQVPTTPDRRQKFSFDESVDLIVKEMEPFTRAIIQKLPGKIASITEDSLLDIYRTLLRNTGTLNPHRGDEVGVLFRGLAQRKNLNPQEISELLAVQRSEHFSYAEPHLGLPIIKATKEGIHLLKMHNLMSKDASAVHSVAKVDGRLINLIILPKESHKETSDHEVQHFMFYGLETMLPYDKSINPYFNAFKSEILSYFLSGEKHTEYGRDLDVFISIPDGRRPYKEKKQILEQAAQTRAVFELAKSILDRLKIDTDVLIPQILRARDFFDMQARIMQVVPSDLDHRDILSTLVDFHSKSKGFSTSKIQPEEIQYALDLLQSARSLTFSKNVLTEYIFPKFFDVTVLNLQYFHRNAHDLLTTLGRDTSNMPSVYEFAKETYGTFLSGKTIKRIAKGVKVDPFHVHLYLEKNAFSFVAKLTDFSWIHEYPEQRRAFVTFFKGYPDIRALLQQDFYDIMQHNAQELRKKSQFGTPEAIEKRISAAISFFQQVLKESEM